MTTAKAFMINTADQHLFSGQDDDLTRVHQGWGVSGHSEHVRPPGQHHRSSTRRSSSGTWKASNTTPSSSAGEPELRVTLTYADPTGSPASAPAPDQRPDAEGDLAVGTVYWGNYGLLDGNWSDAGGSANTDRHGGERLRRESRDGLWVVEIMASEINEDGHVETPELDADFALVCQRRLILLPATRSVASH